MVVKATTRLLLPRLKPRLRPKKPPLPKLKLRPKSRHARKPRWIRLREREELKRRNESKDKLKRKNARG